MILKTIFNKRLDERIPTVKGICRGLTRPHAFRAAKKQKAAAAATALTRLVGYV
jgi:hypothetical protein